MRLVVAERRQPSDVFLEVEEFLQLVSIVAALAATWETGRQLKRLIFDGDDDLWDCVCAAFKPDILSLWDGELLEDIGRSFRLQIFLMLSFGAGALVYWTLATLFAILPK